MKATLTQNEIDKHICVNPDFYDYTKPIVQIYCDKTKENSHYHEEQRRIAINVASFASYDELLQFCKNWVGDCTWWVFSYSNFPAEYIIGENSLRFDDILKFFALEDEDERGAVWAYLDQYNKYFSVENILSHFVGRFENMYEFTQYILAEFKHDKNAYVYECEELEEYYDEHLSKYVIENEGYWFKRNTKTNFAEL